MGLAETLQIDEMIQDFKRMNKRQVWICTRHFEKATTIATTSQPSISCISIVKCVCVFLIGNSFNLASCLLYVSFGPETMNDYVVNVFDLLCSLVLVPISKLCNDCVLRPDDLEGFDGGDR